MDSFELHMPQVHIRELVRERAFVSRKFTDEMVADVGEQFCKDIDRTWRHTLMATENRLTVSNTLVIGGRPSKSGGRRLSFFVGTRFATSSGKLPRFSRSCLVRLAAKLQHTKLRRHISISRSETEETMSNAYPNVIIRAGWRLSEWFEEVTHFIFGDPEPVRTHLFIGGFPPKRIVALSPGYKVTHFSTPILPVGKDTADDGPEVEILRNSQYSLLERRLLKYYSLAPRSHDLYTAYALEFGVSRQEAKRQIFAATYGFSGGYVPPVNSPSVNSPSVNSPSGRFDTRGPNWQPFPNSHTYHHS